MKIKELFENEETGSLIGKKVNDKLIIDKTKDEDWNGDFNCDDLNLTSLEGAPNKINGYFSCANNKNLTSLIGCPQEGVESFYCYSCNISSLEGTPNKINGTFNCVKNPIKSLIGCPQEGVTNFYCRTCNLTSLEGVPKKIVGTFQCFDNPIKSLKGIHKIIEEIDGTFIIPDSVESNILGVLKIKNLGKIIFKSPSNEDTKKEISDIINKYLPNPSPSDIIDCQNELIDAGFEEYAEL